jgi:hypothetical protein
MCVYVYVSVLENKTVHEQLEAKENQLLEAGPD